jgi:hypothetical protein
VVISGSFTIFIFYSQYIHLYPSFPWGKDQTGLKIVRWSREPVIKDVKLV